MSWPQRSYPGDVPEIGHEQATNLLEEVPAADRLYNVTEIAMFASGTVTDDANESEIMEAVDSWVEHMAAGGYVMGQPDAPAQPKALTEVEIMALVETTLGRVRPRLRDAGVSYDSADKIAEAISNGIRSGIKGMGRAPA